MDEMNQGLNVLNREASETLFSFPDQIRKIREIVVRKTTDPPYKIFAVFRKMVGDRREDRMKHLPGTGTGQIPAFRREFLQDRNIFLVKFTWHDVSTGLLFLRL